MKHKLWYQTEAQIFEEALPLGNGALGAMVYGGTAREKIALNLDTLWSGTPHHYQSEDAPKVFLTARQLTLDGKIEEAEQLLIKKFHNYWTSFYLPMANLYIECAGTVPCSYRRGIGSANGGGNHHLWRCFAGSLCFPSPSDSGFARAKRCARQSFCFVGIPLGSNG